jgi:hypothetical protein
LGCATLLAACAAAVGASPDPDFTDEAALNAGSPIGDPVSCIRLRDIDHTRVVSDRMVDFFLRDHSVYRNELSISCGNLTTYGRFTYRTNATRLCSSDAITVVDTAGNIGSTCGLGTFQRLDVPRGYH